MIKKSQLIEMFESMRAEAPWDVDSDLLWAISSRVATRKN
jgi:hypothetical protein